MKTIGLIGGMSWESSLEYYRIINEAVKARLGGLHSADCLMYSFDFAEIEALQMSGDWETATERMIEAAQRLEKGGARCVVICTNTMHKMADAVQNAIDLPLIHIADATAEVIKAQGIKNIGLLGTKFTMQEAFYKGRLVDDHALNVLVPPTADDIATINRIIYDELVLGEINSGSRDQYVTIIEKLRGAGAEGVILGCTEIGLLIKPEDSPIPTFDTTYIHTLAAVDFALA
ncbi:MAG: aspartate/glutamate racemase family protein [Aggregatilineales bacterium]